MNKQELKRLLIDYTDSIRNYEYDCCNSINLDEDETPEFVETFLKDNPISTQPTPISDNEIEALAVEYLKQQFKRDWDKLGLMIFVEGFKQALSMQGQGWISVKDQLPKDTENVLTLNNLGGIFIGGYDFNTKYWNYTLAEGRYSVEDIIGWLPLSFLPTPLIKEV